jgi:hypothetical protein
MTYEELEKLVLDKKAGWALQRALAPLDEKARAKLSAPAQKLHRQLRDRKAAPDASMQLKSRLARSGGGFQARETDQARLALFALCPASVLKKLDYHVWHDLAPLFDQIIRDRRPDWLDDWVANPAGADLPFDILRGWIRDGVCAKPEVDCYYQSFAWFLMQVIPYQLGKAVPPITQQLLADPPLLADIPHLFRIDSGAFGSTPWVKPDGPPDYETWSDALLKLLADGHLDRAELLQAAIDGLKINVGGNQLAGVHGFYKRMEPVQAELLLHHPSYIDLLGHPVSHVVTFAMEMLAKIRNYQDLQVERILPELPAALSKGSKAHALLALRLLKRIITRQNALTSGGVAVIGEALRHPNSDVQSAALDILGAHSAGIAVEDLALLQETEPFVAASNRARFARLLAPAAAINSGRAMAEAAPCGAAIPLDYQPIESDRIQSAILHPEDAITPIGSVGELIDAVLHATETVDSPDEVERIIEAISRLGTSRLADFDASVAPLLHRLKAGGGTNGIIFETAGVRFALRDLLFTWLTGQHHRTPDWLWSYRRCKHGFVPIGTHLRAIATDIHRGRAKPLLSAPTHKGGWIDPIVWIDRLIACDASAVGTIDFRLSLLRLAPDNRVAALERASTLPEPLRRIVQFALGGDVRPARHDRAYHSAWITAARCRDPLKDWSQELAPLKLDDGLADGVWPARHFWRASRRTEVRHRERVELPELSVSLRRVGTGLPTLTEKADSLLGRIADAFRIPIAPDWKELPAAALNRGTYEDFLEPLELSRPWVTQWLCYVWPQNPSASYMRGARSLAERIDRGSSTWNPSRGYFHALFQRGRPWREPGHLLLCLGLVGKDADARGLAIDALIEGIEWRLFDPEIFASTIIRLVEGGWIKFSRLADALMPVIQVSQLHALAASEALQQTVTKIDLQRKNAFRLLEVLVEAQAMTGKPLPFATRQVLAGMRGSGKAAKVAKQLAR